MGAPTLKNNSGVTFTFHDGEVDTVEGTTVADLEQTALPLGGPSYAFLFDFNGATKVIRVTGNLYATDTTRTSSGTVKTILEQKQWLEANINGNQGVRAFTSTYESQSYNGSSFEATKVAMAQIKFTEHAGITEELAFELVLLVGS